MRNAITINMHHVYMTTVEPDIPCAYFHCGKEVGYDHFTMFFQSQQELWTIARAFLSIGKASPKVHKWVYEWEPPIAKYEEVDADPGDMDGDHASALASAGMGTDEDYGRF